MKSKNNHKNNSFGAYAIIITVTVLLIAIAVNLLFSLIPERARRIDLSTEQITKVSSEAKTYLKESLTGKIKIYLVAETGMEDVSLNEFLKRLSEIDDKLISLEVIDPTVKRSFLQDLTGSSPDDLGDNTVIIKGEKYGNVKIISPEGLYTYETFLLDTNAGKYVSDGEYPYREFVSVYASLSEYFSGGYAYYETKFNGESEIISAIDYVLTPTEELPKIYVSAMHGEVALTDSFLEHLELSNLPTEQIILSEDIPDDASVLIINAPSSDISESEAKTLETFLENGGKLVVSTSYQNVSSLKNLTAVLEKYGLLYENKEIFEGDSSFYYPGYQNLLIPDVSVLETLYKTRHYRFLISSAHAIILSDETQNIYHTPLLATSESSYYAPEGEDTEIDDESRSSYNVAVSALAPNGSEVIWFSSPYILTDSDNQMTGGGNYIHLTALLSELCDKNTVFFASKIIDKDVITLSSLQANFWAVILIAVIPGTVIISGIVWIRKRKRG